MPLTPSRRDFLKAGAAAGLGAGLGTEALLSALTADAACNTSLKGIQHVVFLIQENRSFDNYFGALRPGLHPALHPDRLPQSPASLAPRHHRDRAAAAG